MSWQLTLAVALLALAPLALLWVPLHIEAGINHYGALVAWGEVRWIGVAADGAWAESGGWWRIRVLGRELPERPIRASLRWALDHRPATTPLSRERLATELRALWHALSALDAQALRSDGWLLARQLAAALRVEPRLHLRVGVEDPFTLGVLAAAAGGTAWVLPQDRWLVEPMWDGADFEGEAEVHSTVSPARALWALLRFGLFSVSGWGCLRAALRRRNYLRTIHTKEAA